MKIGQILAIFAIAALAAGQDHLFDEPAPKKKSSLDKVTLAIRKVRFRGPPEADDEFNQVIEYVLERADNFNILGEDEQIEEHFGQTGTRIHIPFNPFRRWRRRRRAARPRTGSSPRSRKLKQTSPPRKMIDSGADEPAAVTKKNMHASSGRVLSDSGHPSPQVEHMFSEIFGNMQKLKAREGATPAKRMKAQRHRRKLMLPGGGGGGAVSSAAASPQINDSRIVVHSFAAPAAAPQSYIKAPYSDTSPQVIQTRMQLH